MKFKIPYLFYTSMTIAGFSLFYQCSSPEPPPGAGKVDRLVVAAPAEAIDEKRISTKYVLGKFKPAQDSNFVRIEPQYTSKKEIYLHRESYEAFVSMYQAAARDSIQLRIVSATRNFDDQRAIWEGKWEGRIRLSDGTNAAEIADKATRALRILEYSSMPGTSRHHWGTDIDLNQLYNSYFEKGQGLKEYQWLEANAGKFGFCQPYSRKGPQRPNGYEEEKWHWSYLPLARHYLRTVRDSLQDSSITGFKGAEIAAQLKIVRNYVLGISPECE